MGAPLVISAPHFFGADPRTLTWVDGLNPEESKHGAEVHLEWVSSFSILEPFHSFTSPTHFVFYSIKYELLFRKLEHFSRGLVGFNSP